MFLPYTGLLPRRPSSVVEVLVEFQVSPEWVQSTWISPQRTITRGGKVRVVLQTTRSDVVRILVRVDHTVLEASIAVAKPLRGLIG